MESAAPERPARVAVCVISYRRPEGLARLLGALDRLRLPDPRPALRVVVVDNDPAQSARAVCEQARDWLEAPLQYATEKRRGIPQSRNTALAAALSAEVDFVAFLDDDEYPSEDWLAELLTVQRTHGADAVTGPCLPRFAKPPPEWIAAGGFFERPRFETGALRPTAYTHNVLVRSAALTAMGALFDERMALTGGSDVEFFRRFARAGHRIVWADAAVVYESVPPSRVTLRWLVQRLYRVGTSTAFVDRQHHPGASAELRRALHGLYCVARGALGLAVSPLRGRAAALHSLRLAVYGAGRLAGLLGLRYREYR